MSAYKAFYPLRLPSLIFIHTIFMTVEAISTSYIDYRSVYAYSDIQKVFPNGTREHTSLYSLIHHPWNRRPSCSLRKTYWTNYWH